MFETVDIEDAPTVMQEVFRMIAAARRTDLGGLDRVEALKWCQTLPAAHVLSRELTSTDWVRFLVSALSETARLYHEAGRYENALEIDLYALAIAEPLSDATQTMMVAGNVGACYMGMADHASGDDARALLSKADEFLSRALATASGTITFAVGLHTANLGVVRGELGRTCESVRLIRRALVAIERTYPNYAVCFCGDLGRILATEAGRQASLRKPRFERAAGDALVRGLSLAQKLSDYDDAHFLTRGFRALAKVTGSAGAPYERVKAALKEAGLLRENDP